MKAAYLTVMMARDRGMADLTHACPPSMTLDHITEMFDTMSVEDFSYGKLNRWLGWMQACVVACGCARLEDMKALNMECRDEEIDPNTGQEKSAHPKSKA